jgi:NTP pyrophosphatase (non-canonical NTP hydrolase)
MGMTMRVKEYMRIAEKTDQLEPKSPTDPNFKIMPILGLAGEIGSLLAELKKRVREPNRKTDVGMKPIKEELGDIIWYATTIARRAGLDFEKDILLKNLQRIRDRSANYWPSFNKSKAKTNRLRNIIAAEGVRAVNTFDTYKQNAATSAISGRDTAALIPYLARIWRNSGELLEQLNTSQPDFSDEERKQIIAPLGDVMWYVAGFATLFDQSLDEVALLNAEKAQSMFAPGSPTPLYDLRDKLLEQFPRKFNVDFVSIDHETAVMLVNGLRIGDPLKDNSDQGEGEAGGIVDGYRFHDCVHLAFVAVLGWSPVVRGLMKRKRKSRKKIDDAQDGARAQIVEEMIVKLTHSYAVGVDRIHLLNGRKHVSMDLLKQIEMLTEGLEVKANKLWEWEKAILQGYEIFDQLRRHRRGRVWIDLRSRSVSFQRLAKGEGEAFPKLP